MGSGGSRDQSWHNRSQGNLSPNNSQHSWFSTSRHRRDEAGTSRHSQRGEGDAVDELQADDFEGKDDGYSGELEVWVHTYFAKMRGSTPLMPPRASVDEAALTFVGVFVVIALPMLLCESIRTQYVELAGVFGVTMPASFGALATLLFALQSAPLAQPRVLLAAHLFAITVSVLVLFVFSGAVGQMGHMVWLQTGLACGLSVAGMSKMGILHPVMPHLLYISPKSAKSGKCPNF
jgi:hypothetical protein